ncbi:hypothetical protein ABIA24_001278 [Sinorhizobium fredii]
MGRPLPFQKAPEDVGAGEPLRSRNCRRRGVKRVSLGGSLLGLLLKRLMRTSREVKEYRILAYPRSNGIKYV